MDIPSGSHLQTPDDDQGHHQFDVSSFYTNYCVLSADSISLSSPEVKLPKRRKPSSEKIQVGGARIVRSGGGRRDRHSKVCTARGTRDRRVRLSPNTAIQFYDVQDRLGYDRPSKAIDWLMKEAKAAIDALDEPPPPQVAGNQNSPIGGIIVDDGAFEHLNKAVNPDSGFGFFTAPPSSSHELQTYGSEGSMLHQEGFLSSISSDLFDPNLDMIRLSRNSHFPWSTSSAASSGSGQHNMFIEREPLQSSIIDNSLRHQFSGFRLPHEEIPNFEAMEEGKDKIPPFLHHHHHHRHQA